MREEEEGEEGEEEEQGEEGRDPSPPRPVGPVVVQVAQEGEEKAEGIGEEMGSGGAWSAQTFDSLAAYEAVETVVHEASKWQCRSRQNGSLGG